MKTVRLIQAKGQQTICLPKEFEFQGVSQLEITRENEALVLRPVRKSWLSFADAGKADADFLSQRPDVM